jgi:hypothetical protein
MLTLYILFDNILFSIEQLLNFIGKNTHDFIGVALWIILPLGTAWLISTFLVWSVLMLVRLITKRAYLPKPIARFSLAVVGITIVSLGIMGVLSGFVSNFLGFAGPFPPFNLNFPTTLALLLGGPVIITGWIMSVITPKIITFEVSKRALLVFGSIISALSLGALFFTVVAMLYYQSPCEGTLRFSRYHVHAFNQHLKDLCYFRTDKSECPKSEAELMAFRPDAYVEIQACAETRYFYDDQAQNYVWEIDSHVDRYGTQKYPQF